MDGGLQPHEVRNTVVAAAVGLVGGLGAGMATMAGPQAFPKAPTWVWESLLWAGIAVFIGAVCYLICEYWIRPRRMGKPKLDQLQVIALVAAIILVCALALQVIRGPLASPAAAPPSAQDTGASVVSADMPVFATIRTSTSVLGSTPLTAELRFNGNYDRIRVVLDFSSSATTVVNPVSWQESRSTSLADFKDVVRGSTKRVTIIHNPSYEQQPGKFDFRWGAAEIALDPPALIWLARNRARLRVIGPDGREQEHRFIIILTQNDMSAVETAGKPTMAVFDEDDVKSALTWEK
jgi:hypothetical protein